MSEPTPAERLADAWKQLSARIEAAARVTGAGVEPVEGNEQPQPEVVEPEPVERQPVDPATGELAATKADEVRVSAMQQLGAKVGRGYYRMVRLGLSVGMNSLGYVLLFALNAPNAGIVPVTLLGLHGLATMTNRLVTGRFGRRLAQYVDTTLRNQALTNTMRYEFENKAIDIRQLAHGAKTPEDVLLVKEKATAASKYANSILQSNALTENYEFPAKEVKRLKTFSRVIDNFLLLAPAAAAWLSGLAGMRAGADMFQIYTLAASAGVAGWGIARDTADTYESRAMQFELAEMGRKQTQESVLTLAEGFQQIFTDISKSCDEVVNAAKGMGPGAEWASEREVAQQEREAGQQWPLLMNEQSRNTQGSSDDFGSQR